MNWAKDSKEGVIIELHIIPNAKKNEILGEYNNKLKIKISSPPVEGNANKEIIKFLSKILKINKSKIKIISGEKNRDKKIAIESINSDFILKQIGRN